MPVRRQARLHKGRRARCSDVRSPYSPHEGCLAAVTDGGPSIGVIFPVELIGEEIQSHRAANLLGGT